MDNPSEPENNAGSSLAPLPKRVADDSMDAHLAIADPAMYVDGLLERAAVLLSTLAADSDGLTSDQQAAHERIENNWKLQKEMIDEATARLAALAQEAELIASHKARLPEFESAINPRVPMPPPEVVTAEVFLALMEEIEAELKAAPGIAGAMRLPHIATMLNQAWAALTMLAGQIDEEKTKHFADAAQVLAAERREAEASFEIGISILDRDLETLDNTMPLVARRWSDPGWQSWHSPVSTAGWVRIGDHVAAQMPDSPIPRFMRIECGEGIVIEGGSVRDVAIEGIRSLVLRILAAVPAGMARFTFIDANSMGEAVVPFFALAEFDESLAGASAIVLEADIESHLEALTRHVEWVTTHCLQARYANLAEYHVAIGAVIEPYRYLVIFDHPDGFSDAAKSMLAGLIAAGPRCGVTIIVMKAPHTRRSAHAGKGSLDLPTISSDHDGLSVTSEKSGTWKIVLDVPPPLKMSAPSEPAGIFERVITEVGIGARDRHNARVAPSTVFALLGEDRQRQVRVDLPVTSGLVDPDDPTTWWRGDATTGLGAPIGQTESRMLISPWLDESHGGIVVMGPPDAGVSSVVQAMVDSLTVIYPPDECQLYLVAIATKRSFGRYADEALPHARVVANDVQRDFGVSVLEEAIAILELRRVRLDVAGTERLGLVGHRASTGEQIARVVIAIEGVAELLSTNDEISAKASQLLSRLASEGPQLGLHLLLVDRALNFAAGARLLELLPPEIGYVVRISAIDEDPVDFVDDAVPTAIGDRPPIGSATISGNALAGEVIFHSALTERHLQSITSRDLRRLATERGYSSVPQVWRGDDAADLTRAPLLRLRGNEAHRASRLVPTLWLGEPIGMGPPVEVLLRRQEGANVMIVSEDPALGQGMLLAAVAAAAMAHDDALEVWILDFAPIEGGFGSSMLSLGGGAVVRLGRRRNLSKTLDRVHRIVQDRLMQDDRAGPPCLLVINAISRAHDFSAGGLAESGALAALPQPPTSRAHEPLDPVGVIEAILRDGPEVGVHTLVWSENLDSLSRRLGPWALGEFSARVGTSMGDADSFALLDSPSAATLRDGQALLYDDARGRLVRFRPYALPRDDWSLPR